jgi:small subunit ribosomal protein S3
MPLKKNWQSNWFSSKNYGKNLQEDLKIRDFIKKKLQHASVARVEIGRSRGIVEIIVFSSRPGVVIGRKGEGVERLQKELAKITKEKTKIDIKEIRKPEIWAQIMAGQLVYQLERRMAFRRAMKQVLEEIMRNSQIQGARVKIKGRLGGTEIARSESLTEGSIPLQTLRADIDYGFALARTKFGSIGVKVWINRGESKEQREKE